MSVKYQDYYASLGVSRSATADDIRSAFRKLARQFHPDVNKDPKAAERFKQINEAYEVLSDPAKRQKYDQFGANWKNGDDFSGSPQWEDFVRRQGSGSGRGASSAGKGFSFNMGGRGFSDFFESLFGDSGDLREAFAHAGFEGGGFDHGATQRDIEAEVELSVADAMLGGTRRLSLTDPDGSRKTLDVKIPAGVASGDSIRLAGQGRSGGDLRLRVRLVETEALKVSGRDVALRLDVAPWEAALGGKVDVPAPGGALTVTLPAGASGKLRLRGKGLPARGGQPAGDLIVELRVVVPKNLSEAQKTALKAWRDSMDGWSPR